MPLENLLPISDAVIAHAQLFHSRCIGQNMRLHSAQEGVPSLEGARIAIIGVRENRGAVDVLDEKPDFSAIRKAFYQLFPGNWSEILVDLGDIDAGDSLKDTFFAVRQITEFLFKQDIIPMFLGGCHDLVYAMYRAYDKLDQMVNLVNVDSRFDLGDSSLPMTNKSFVGKIIIDEPYNLFNYSSLGYQTFLNSQDEIDLMQRLYFDAYRLGTVTQDVKAVEPVVRDADIVTFDLAAIQGTDLGFMFEDVPNGLNGREACAIARYAGISDRVSSFGVFEYRLTPKPTAAASLIAQMLWYFVEGVNYRVNERLVDHLNEFLHYSVPVDNEVLSFYKSEKTDRWWIEIPFIQGVNNKLKRHTLLPCTHQDYLNACNQEIPERWYKARMKNEI
ncbi:MAG: arginase [Cytophagaceae bacterium]|nr:arginase [Cytophagaceae bacterium]|tara:strand:+ start:10128 stop:11294 length:1167 start_codon:yes stop_codon:yes gene_type:complete